LMKLKCPNLLKPLGTIKCNKSFDHSTPQGS
jgi:hypothetical protein